MVKYKEEYIGLAIDEVGGIISLEIKKIYKSKEKFSRGTFSHKGKRYNLINLDRLANLGEKDILI